MPQSPQAHSEGPGSRWTHWWRLPDSILGNRLGALQSPRRVGLASLQQTRMSFQPTSSGDHPNRYR
eukprot:7384479-Prymnesium_polylepis.1